MLNDVLRILVRRLQGSRRFVPGLLVTYAVAQQANAIVRGIRAISDYEYELQMALMTAGWNQIETVLVMPADTYSYLSSRRKEVFQLGGPIDGLVPPPIEKRMEKR